MVGENFLLHTGQTAVILPTTSTLETLEQVGEVLLAATIALLVVVELPWSVHVDLEDARPWHAMAMRTTASTDACVADDDVTGVAPLAPDIIGYG